MTIFVQHTLIFVVSSKNLEKSAESLQHRLQGLVDRARHHVEPKSSAKPQKGRKSWWSSSWKIFPSWQAQGTNGRSGGRLWKFHPFERASGDPFVSESSWILTGTCFAGLKYQLGTKFKNSCYMSCCFATGARHFSNKTKTCRWVVSLWCIFGSV